MPATYRSNVSWKSKELHDEAKELCEKNDETISGHIQDHFRKAIRKAQKGTKDRS